MRWVLVKPTDYFDRNFLSTLSDMELKLKILDFLDLIILEGYLNDSVLQLHSINLDSFKGKDYLQFGFTHTITYNFLRLDKYDVGKQIFDEFVRKILNPLNTFISQSNLFFGYDLTIVGHIDNVSTEKSNRESVEYRFFIPEEIVRQYKNKDISGQKVLDESVILMDDERVEFKLQ